MDPTNFPSSFLPLLTRHQQHSPAQIWTALAKIEQIYLPINSLVIPSGNRTRKRKPGKPTVPDSGYASADEDEDLVHESLLPMEPHLHLLKQDPIERQFVIKWLTGFVARSDTWIGQPSPPDGEDIVDKAATLLSSFAGSSDETEAVLRSFSFPSPELGIVSVELNDAPLSSVDHTSVGLQSWGSSILLAARMCESPSQFIPRDVSGLRFLELGAGTGLLSIVAAQIRPDSTIVATDFHPDVLENLSRNIEHNVSGSGLSVSVRKFDWEAPHFSAPFDSTFDVVLAADVIYHDNHARWLKGCVQRLLGHGGIFWLVIPIRSTGRHEGKHWTVNEVFADTAEEDCQLRLAILDEQNLARHGNFGRADEDGYKLYKIGWSDATR